MGSNQIHSNEPLGKWNFGVLKDSADKAREVLVAMCAVESSVLGGLAVVFATIRADDVTVCPSAFDDSLLAGGFVIEVIGKRDKAVELGKIYHILQWFYIQNIINSGLKVQPLEC